MVPISFVKKLRQQQKNGRLCFVFVDSQRNLKISAQWAELKSTEDIIILYRDMHMMDNEFFVTYYFTFADEEVAEAYRAMIEL